MGPKSEHKITIPSEPVSQAIKSSNEELDLNSTLHHIQGSIMVQKALLGWAESLTSIYNIVSKKNQPRAPKKLLELSCLHKLPQMSGSQQQPFRNLCDALLLVAVTGKLQGMGWAGTVGDSPWCSKLRCTGKNYPQHPRAVWNVLPNNEAGENLSVSNQAQDLIPFHMWIQSMVFVFTEFLGEGNSYVNPRQKLLCLVPAFTKGCLPLRKLESVRAVSPRHLNL